MKKMHPLNFIILFITVTSIIYYFLRKLECWSSSVNRIKNKAKDIEDKVKAFDEMKKVSTKVNKKKVKEVNKFLKEKNS